MICKCCGMTYEGTPTSLFCSDDCYNFDKFGVDVCIVCKVRYIKKIDNQKYCSQECYHKSYVVGVVDNED